MLKTILSISGKPGLYKLISQGRNMLIVESLTDKKRFPAYGNEKIISLGDIAMYTDTDDVPLKDVLTAMKEKENGAAVVMDLKKATADELRAYLGEVLPTFDRDRVYLADIKKLISWYNLLVACGITDFEDTAEADIEGFADGGCSDSYRHACRFGRYCGLFFFRNGDYRRATSFRSGSACQVMEQECLSASCAGHDGYPYSPYLGYDTVW